MFKNGETQNITVNADDNVAVKKLTLKYSQDNENWTDIATKIDTKTASFSISGLNINGAVYKFVGVYYDKAVTGSKEKRTGFQQMLSDAKDKKFDLIITKSISRFARNTVTVLKYSRELREIGVGILFEEEHINTLSKDGELMLSVLSSFAQEELRSMSANQKWTIQKRYKEGIVNAQGMMGYYKNEYADGKYTLDFLEKYREIGGKEKFEEFKQQLIHEFNTLLHIEGFPKVEKLNVLSGSFVNLEYHLPNGQSVKFLDDNATYLGSQLECEFGGERCFGIAANMEFLLICTYEENGKNPELVFYKKR